MVPSKRPYTGINKSLVIGIDIGTTHSGVSYTFLDPGQVPQIRCVTRFSGQCEGNFNSKVPSVVCYDQDGNVVTVGPETDPEVNPELSEIEGVRRVEWFKLRLWPPHLVADNISKFEKLWIPPEPAEENLNDDCAKGSDEDKDKDEVPLDVEEIGREGSGLESLNKKNISRPVTDDFKTVVQVLADLLQYLFESAKKYIIESETSLDPTFTWTAIEKYTYFVLTHPNGWEGKQQSQMRDAAVVAGLVDSLTAMNRITFVTEGEASLHFCLDKNPELHQELGGLMVVDCGGGIINLSAYSQTEKRGFKEIASPDCLLQGSIFVTSRARDHFKAIFTDSKFGSDHDIDAMARAFDKPEGAKCIFSHPNKPYFVKFGKLRDQDSKYDICRGRFKVEGAQVAEFFELAVKDIIDGIIKQCGIIKDGVSIKYVLLVGGFGRSQYLYARLSDYFKPSGIVVFRPDITHRNKVANGAVSWYLNRYVSARVAKYSYGIKLDYQFDPANPEHVRRESTKFMRANGTICIPGGFLGIMKRNTSILEETEYRNSYCRLFTPDEYSRCSTIFINLKCYRRQTGNLPKWIDLEPSSFHDLCTIEVDTMILRRNMKPKNSGTKWFYELNFDLVILFGSTELRASVAWNENGLEKRYAFSVDNGI